MKEDGKKCTLEIHDAVPEDSGEYKFVAKNEGGTKDAVVYVTVEKRPVEEIGLEKSDKDDAVMSVADAEKDNAAFKGEDKVSPNIADSESETTAFKAEEKVPLVEEAIEPEEIRVAESAPKEDKGKKELKTATEENEIVTGEEVEVEKQESVSILDAQEVEGMTKEKITERTMVEEKVEITGKIIQEDVMVTKRTTEEEEETVIEEKAEVQMQTKEEAKKESKDTVTETEEKKPETKDMGTEIQKKKVVAPEFSSTPEGSVTACEGEVISLTFKVKGQKFNIVMTLQLGMILLLDMQKEKKMFI